MGDDGGADEELMQRLSKVGCTMLPISWGSGWFSRLTQNAASSARHTVQLPATEGSRWSRL
jgi:hypothetical protein